jgi:uncharacterized protein (TIGR00369 family)
MHEDDDMVAVAREALASQPFSALLGAKLTRFEHQYAELRVPITASLLQQHGYVHGGVLAYAADNALTFAGGTVLGPAVLTAEFKINYLRPARGESLRAYASVLSSSGRQAVCRCEIFALADGEETLCAAAQGTIVRVSER